MLNCAFLLFAYALGYPEVMSFKEWHEIFGYHANHYSSRKTVYSRQSAYKANLEKIQAHNAKNLSWTMGVNQYSDLTADEFGDLMGFSACRETLNRTQKMFLERQKGRLPQMRNPKNMPAVDWRSKENPLMKVAVTSVKDQGGCGSCWSFSTAGAVEGAWAAGGNDLVSLSEQQLVSCDKKDDACNGGLMDWAFEYILDNGITSEVIYPYVSGDGNVPVCDETKVKQVVATISDYIDVEPKKEDTLENALNKGPVAIGIEADEYAFQSYRSGVLTGECGSSLDHGVLAAGYGHDSDSNLDYWIVKNSWGASWGMNGYIYLERHISSSSGQCGILLQPSYPVVGTSPTPSPGPTPNPTPKPTPSPGPSPSTDNYEDPEENEDETCNDGETKVIYPYGANGRMCMPSCVTTSDCPAPPAGWNAPSCILPYGNTTLCGFDCMNDPNYCNGETTCTDVLGVLKICLYQ